MVSKENRAHPHMFSLRDLIDRRRKDTREKQRETGCENSLTHQHITFLELQLIWDGIEEYIEQAQTEADQIDDMVDVQTGEQCAEREVTAESRICNRRRLRCSKADLAPKVYSNESKTK